MVPQARDFSTRNDQFACGAMESPTVPNIGDRVDPSCSLVPDPALEAIRLSSIDLCVGLFIIEGRQQRHATFEALHGHHDVETFLDVLRTPRVFLLYSATSEKPFRGKNFVRTAKRCKECGFRSRNVTKAAAASSTWRSSEMPGRFKNQSAVLCAVFRTKPRQNAPPIGVPQ